MSLDATDQPVRAVFLTALEQDDPSKRRAFLDAACGIDTDRRREIEQLLAVHEAGLSSPLDDAVAQLVPTEFLTEEKSTEPALDLSTSPPIGPYKLREQIGEGGFGVVYVAEQSVPVKRKVALKVIKPGMDTKEVIARFEAERQALAMMDHPHIARVYDAGTTETGRPYFVMELIRGMPITKFCRERKLGLREQLKLFIDVCRAVQHAHQKGIIHRDLKPSNILVTLHDGVPVVKVIDFGVAKALTQKLTEQTVYTRHAQMIGTPAYMSPEQAELSGLDMDTRSDVYSLGVLLYELLTGTTPFDQLALVSKGYDEMRRILREEDPPRPSYRVSTLDVETLSTICKERGLASHQWSVALKRELDWIAMKALEKKRERRYESASAFAADLERYLNDEPVDACPPSVGYRVRKFGRRYRGLLATLCLVLLTAIIGMAVSFSYARKATLGAGEARAAQRVAEYNAQVAADHAKQAADNARVADEAKEMFRTLFYASEMKLISDAIANRDILGAAGRLKGHLPKSGERDLRGFEWNYYKKQIHRSPRAALEQGGPVNDVEISPDGRWLAATAAFGSVQIYETTGWSKHRPFWTMTESVKGLAWSPDTQLLAAACMDGSVRIWDFSTGTQIRKIPAHEGIANDVLFSWDGKFLYSCGDDHLAKCWDVRSGKEVRVFTGHDRGVERIDLSPDGSKLATAGSDRVFAIWDAKTGEQIHEIKMPLTRCVCVKFSPDGRFVAAGNITGFLLLADVQTGTREELPRQLDGIEALLFLDHGKWLVTADRGGVIQCHPMPGADGKPANSDSSEPLRWVAHQGRALSLTATPDGGGLISGGRDGMVHVWIRDRAATRWSLSQDPDRSDIATGAHHRLYVAGREITIWDLEQRTLIDSFGPVDSGWIRIACSRDGRYLAAVRTGQIAVFDLASRTIIDQWTIDERLEPKAIALSTNGRWVAFAEYTDREFVTVYDRLNPLEPKQFPARQCECLAFSPDGLRLAAGNMDDVHLFDLETNQRLHVLKGHSTTLADVAFHPKGDLLASVSHDRLLKIWEVESGRERSSGVAYKDRATSVALSPNGHTIAVAGNDLVVKLWHTETGKPLGEMEPESSMFRKVQFSADGLKLIALDRQGKIIVYDASPLGMSKKPSGEVALPWESTDSR